MIDIKTKSIHISIPNGCKELINILHSNGYEAFLCGGAVRDSILKRPIHDYDITTSATPDEMLEIFNDKRIIETGLQHGTITIVIDGESYEVTTYRIDGNYSDSRRPDKVTFTKSLEEDLKRRDFTINAMAYNDEVGIVDPFSGIEDIKYHKIKCVGKPEDRFAEDALRILRAIRFASQLNFVLEPNTDHVLHKMYRNLENISVERINSEFCKIAASSDFCVQMVLYSDVLSLFIPEIKDMFDFPQKNPYHIYDVWGHTIHAVEAYFCDCEEDLNPIDLITSLAVFFHDIGKPYCYQDGEDGIRHFKGHGKVSADMSDTILRRLRFDNDTRKAVVQLVYYHDATFEVGEKYVKRWLNKIGQKQFERLLKLRRADIMAQNPEYVSNRLDKIEKIEHILSNVLETGECFSIKDLTLNGDDVMKLLSIGPGKQVGIILNSVLNEVMDGKLSNTKNDIEKWIISNFDGE